MKDVYFEGPDVMRLLSDVAVNTMKNFGPNKAKQIVTCNHEGHVIGDAILFGHAENKVSVVGRPSVPNWVEYNAIKGGYDVKVTRDERTVANQGRRLIYRYQIQGPNALELIKSVHEGAFPEIPFFNLGDLRIAGRRVRALNHSMSRMGGLEMHGPAEDGDVVREAILKAGPEVRPGAGRQPLLLDGLARERLDPFAHARHLPRRQMKPYREWLPADGFEANASLGGSFSSPNIEDYYQTPWDLGYGRHVKFDHDFIGREALEKLATQPHRRKVWLRWNKEDSLKIFASQFGEGERYKYMEMPNAYYAILPFDKVLVGGKLVGLSTYTVYTVNVRGWFSLAMLDEDVADGSEVTLIWGEENGGSPRPVRRAPRADASPHDRLLQAPQRVIPNPPACASSPVAPTGSGSWPAWPRSWPSTAPPSRRPANTTTPARRPSSCARSSSFPAVRKRGPGSKPGSAPSPGNSA
jgi:vanillate/3-O-methylgallate O-demethylase